VWRDPITGMYNITRYEDLRKVLLDTDNFPSERPRAAGQFDDARARKIQALYREKGWLPAATLAGRDDPNHKQMRAMFDQAFRASKIKEMDPFVEALAHRLVDAFIDGRRMRLGQADGRTAAVDRHRQADWVRPKPTSGGSRPGPTPGSSGWA